MKTKLLCSVIGLFLLVVAAADAQTVTSHLNGNWNDVNTWVGTVPTSSTDVIVNDTVSVTGAGGSCRNLTITARGMILGPSPLTVYGNIVNNGALKQSNGNFSIYIMGNATNNGTWTPDVADLIGTQRQDIAQAPGKPFEGTHFYNSDTAGVRATSAVTFKTDVYFASNTGGRWTTLDMQNYALTVNGYLFNSINVINAGDVACVNNGSLRGVNCTGNINVRQRVLISSSVTFFGNVTITDTLRSDGNAWLPLTINGNVTNLGIVDGHIELDITGNIANRGIWIPEGGTYLIGTQRQELSQAAGKVFEGGYVRSSDTAGVKATSALTFRTAVDFSYQGRWTTLDMQNNALTIDGVNGGSFWYTSIINASDITCINNGVLTNLTCSGNPNLHQRVWVDRNVTFIGSLTITDTLRSKNNAWLPLTISGNVTNLGIVDGHIELDITGNIANRGIWMPEGGTYLLTGGTNRKIRGRFDGPVTFQQTGTPAAGIVQVDTMLDNRNSMTASGVTLEVPSGSALYNYGSLSLYGGSISNKGKISYLYKVTTSQNYNFYNGSMTIPSNSGLDSLTVEHYGYQLLSTFTNACKSRWNIIARPSSVHATATALAFHYNDDELASNLEASLQVYQAPDTTSWTQVSTSSNVTRDVSGNNITVTAVPLYGNYALSTLPPSTATGTLLVNGDAEKGSISGWIDPDATWEASPGGAHGGSYSFDPGRLEIEFTRTYQDVNVSPYASSIDAGKKYFTLSGWMEDKDQNPNDKCTIAIAALSASGTELGYVARDHRNPYWSNYIIAGKIPPNTKTLRVYLIGTRFYGTYCDAYFDDINLTLADNPPAGTVTITSQTGKSDVAVNGTLKLSATTAGTVDSSYTWSSSYDRIATVDKNGLVTAVGSGVVVIQAIGNKSQSANTFTVTCYPQNYIEFTSPVGDEYWTTGSTATIRWKVIGTVGSCTLSYSTASGTNWQTIATISNPSVQQYTWSIPSMSQQQGECYLKLNWGSDEAISGRFSLVLTVVNAVTRESIIPSDFVLYDNFPNPFNPSTTISFGLPEDTRVSLKVYNLLGAEVKTLAQGNYSAGYHTMRFDASNLPSGVYLYSLRTSKAALTRKMLLIK